MRDDLCCVNVSCIVLLMVHGCRCWCNLHGRECAPSSDGGRLVCVCQHNTAGDSCEKCLPLYNNRPWQAGSYLPYPNGTANECQSTLLVSRFIFYREAHG